MGLPEFEGNVLVRGRLFVDEAQSGHRLRHGSTPRLMEHYGPRQ